ncbi:MAG: hypothetical protein ABIK09_04800 [Pseudomonadota bacterium]
MTFDYMQSDVSERFNKDIEGRFDEAFLAEVQERARLLFNLHLPLDEAVERISKNVEWEFDRTWTSSLPAVHERTQEVVTAVYAKLTR